MSAERIAKLAAAELKTVFACMGHFYEIVLTRQHKIACRSVLEIFRRDAIKQPEALDDVSPDAVVVMMNPGSSRPLAADTFVPLLQPEDIFTFADVKKLVPTQPDNTQYQVMRLMMAQNWHHVRVLNLSDLRESKSPEFLKKIAALQKRRFGALHSIFCDARSDELQRAVPSKTDLPIIAGWGLHPDLLPLATACRQKLPNAQFMGIVSDSNPLLYRHPLPTLQRDKERWLINMLALLQPDM